MTFAIWKAQYDVRQGEDPSRDTNLDRPAIAALPNGGYVVGWREDNQLKFKVYNGGGVTTGTVYSIDAGTATQNMLDIQAVGMDGSFAVSWNEGSSNPFDLKTRVFSHNGDGIYVGGSVTLVADNVTIDQTYLASMTANMNGGFASTYMTGNSIYLSMHDASGAKIENATYVVHNGQAQATITLPETVQLTANKFAVSYTQDNNVYVKVVTIGQTFPTTGTLVGQGGKSEIVALKDKNGAVTGQFAVVRQLGDRIVAKFYDTDGTAIPNTNKVVITNVAGGDSFSVVALRGGRIAVAHSGDGADQDSRAFLTIKDMNGNGPEGGSLALSVAINQHSVKVVEMTDGRVAVTWEDPSRGYGDISSAIVDPRLAPVPVAGTQRNDYYVGSEYDDDELYGNGGNDTLVGGAGNDDLYGGAGADDFRGGEGSDTVSYIQAAEGVEVYLWKQGGSANKNDALGDTFDSIEVINGSQHDDVIEGDGGNNVLWGYGGNDTLKGHGGNDILNGGHGADTLHGGAGADYMEGGARDGNGEYADEDIDILSYVDSATGVTVDLEERKGAGEGESKGDVFIGMDRLHGSVHNDVLYGRNTDGDAGESKDDNIFAAAGHDLILGRDGNDILDGWDGNDTLEGGDGVDLLDSGDGMDLLEGGLGNDTLKGGGGNDTLEGGLGAEALDGGGGFDFASYAKAGERVVASLGMPSVVAEGEAAEDAYVDDSIEGLIGSQYDDILYGHDNKAIELRGGAGNDTLEGGAGNDADDTLEGGAGADVLSGGEGESFDYASYAHAGPGLVADLTNVDNDFAPTGLAGLAGKGDAAGDVYASIEGLIGSAHADALYGDEAANHLRGMGSHDVLVGRGGADTLDGGAGNDTYHVDRSSDRVVETANNGTDTVIASTHFSLMEVAHVENLTAIAGTAGLRLTGSTLANRITGNGGKNTLKGEGGNDTLTGGAGADTLYGGTGNDTFYVDNTGDRVIESSRGGTDTVRTRVSFTLGSQTENLTAEGSAGVTLKGSSLANTITGNSGANKIHGGLGNDLLRGGSGKDVFVFDTRPNKSSNVDKVYDFSSSSDSFHLENKVFTKLGSGSSSGVRFKSDMFVEASKAQDREDRIVYDRKKGYLYYDADGTGSSDQVKIATISNKAKLYYHDFFVI